MSHPLFFWIAVLTALVWAASAIEMGLGTRRIRLLPKLPPPAPGDPRPTVTVVIPARNEEAKLGIALRSILAQDYPARVVVVNDRSTDGTGPILEALAVGHPRLEVLHIDELPAGWIGKNHALARGAALSDSDWLLFTDADIVFHPGALGRAIAYATREGLDHLAIAPTLVMPSVALEAFAGTFAIHFARFARPWKARDPRSRAHVGVGAFNLVRRSAYDAVGGHASIAMRPDDDLKLGKILKRAGFRQDVVFGGSMVSVEWYATIPEAVRGLEKNTFAGLEYSVARVAAACLALLTLDVLPFVALFLTDGPTRLLNAFVVGLALLLFAGSTRGSGARPALGVLFPFAGLLFVFIVLRSTFLALRNDGIRWRETHYPLEQLRANRV